MTGASFEASMPCVKTAIANLKALKADAPLTCEANKPS